MTPNVKGLGGALAKLKHDLEMQASSALSEMTALSQRATEAIGKAKQKIADTKAAVEEIETFVSDDEGSNGGPSLDGSSESSEVSQSAAATVMPSVVPGRTL